MSSTASTFSYGILALVLLHLLAAPVSAQADGGNPSPSRNDVPVLDSQRHVIHSHHVGDAFVIDVALLVPYDPANTYPLVLATDGNFTFTTIVGASRLMTMFGELPHFILVTVGYQTIQEARTKRVRDLTPTADDTHPVCQTGESACGGARAYLSFLADELFPFLGERYPVDLEAVTYVGHSLGGLFGAWVMFAAPETFQNYVLGSPPFRWDDGSVLAEEEGFFASSRPLPARVYMAVGSMEDDPGTPFSNSGLLRSYGMMRTLLEERKYDGLHLTAETLPGEMHGSVLPSVIFRGLRAVMRPERFQAIE